LDSDPGPSSTLSRLSDNLLFNSRELMHPGFKLFLGNQRMTQTNANKLKIQNAKSFRMRTHNVAVQSKDLSARQYSFGSCELTNNFNPNKQSRKELIEKLNICTIDGEKDLPAGEKRQKIER
jgi:hypothetical protein